jgi:hypothetical protein
VDKKIGIRLKAQGSKEDVFVRAPYALSRTPVSLRGRFFA